MTLPGFPANNVFFGTNFLTTDPAPIIEFSSTLVPDNIWNCHRSKLHWKYLSFLKK